MTAFIPGFLFYRRFLHADGDAADIVLSASFVCSVFLISTMAFIAYLTGKPTAVTNTFLYLLTLWALAWTKTRVAGRWLAALATFLLFAVVSLQLLKLMPSYQAAYTLDWSLYYPNTTLYLGGIQPSWVTEAVQFEYLAKRTPFFTLFNAFYLTFTGRSYAAYQVISLALNAMAMLSVLGLTARFFGARAARIALAMLPFTPLMFFAVVVPTPKFLAAFCFLTALAAYARIRSQAFAPAHRRDRWLCTLAAVTAYMCHPSAAVYLLVIVVDQAIVLLRGRRRPPWRAIAGPVAAATVLVAPWFVWAVLAFGSDRVFVPTYTISQQHLTIGEYLSTRVLMLATTAFMPATLFHALVGGGSGGQSWMETFGNPLVRFYWETFLGGMTVSATLCGVVALARRRTLPAELKQMIGWTATGALGTMLVHLLVDPEGHAANVMAPLAVLWFVVLWGTLAGAPRGVRAVAVIGALVEFVVAMRLVYLVASVEPPAFQYLSAESGVLGGAGLVGFCLTLALALAGFWGTGVFSTENG